MNDSGNTHTSEKRRGYVERSDPVVRLFRHDNTAGMIRGRRT